MIQSKRDYQYYLEADRLAIKKFNSKRPRLVGDEVWIFLRSLRKLEYMINCKRGPFWKLIRMYCKVRHHKLSLKTGITIHPNSFGPGLAIFHHGTIIVNSNARIGKDCQLYNCTNIADGVKVGNKVFIGPGAKLLNNVQIADGVRIGANSVVTKSFTEPNVTIAGNPAKKISDVGTEHHYVGGTDRMLL
ncbi:serine acetyltransferase [Paenibacillus mesophilus]|uniref:serine O-acetyltransferase n=1 Tax=Paenibacillus mesophilus TaxID=2582849 RepID=UPI00110F1D27|nr:serine acetyltransferase [Paenibacillus mesophilus]TMV47487.1 serine acetyltransferase [Paenibacillus mesophilus]